MPRRARRRPHAWLPRAMIAAATLTAGCGSGGGGTSDVPAAVSTTAPPSSTTAGPTTNSPPETTTTTTTTSTTPPAELELIGPGPYRVGVRTITVDNADRERPLTVDVWFPLGPSAAGEPHRYTFVPGVYYESPMALGADDFSTIAPDGPYPLVVYSHGSGGLRYIHSRYTETIASHGYVVAAPDHTGNTAVDLILQSSADPAVTAVNRPNDVDAVIDELVDPASESAAALVEHIDPDRIAVTGHSFGGFTSYAVVAGYESPAGRSDPDGRVDAIITLAPAASAQLLTDAALAAVDVPSLVIGATDDQTTPIDPNVTRPWALVPGRPAYRLDLVGAEHQTFTDVCEYVGFLPTLDAVPDVIIDTIDEFAAAGCQPDDMPSDRAQELVATFAMTFLEEVFREGEPIDSQTTALPPDVRYEARPD